MNDLNREFSSKFLITYDTFEYYYHKYYNLFFNDKVYEHDYQKQDRLNELIEGSRLILQELEKLNEYDLGYSCHSELVLVKDKIMDNVREIGSFLNNFQMKKDYIDVLFQDTKNRVLLIKDAKNRISDEATKHKNILGIK